MPRVLHNRRGEVTGVCFEASEAELEADLLRGIRQANKCALTAHLLAAAHEIVCGRLGAQRRGVWTWRNQTLSVDQSSREFYNLHLGAPWVEEAVENPRYLRARRQRQEALERARDLRPSPALLDCMNAMLRDVAQQAAIPLDGCTWRTPARLQRVEPRPKITLSTGVQMEAYTRELDHPHGRFVRANGGRFDICVIDVRSDPSIRAPGVGELKGVTRFPGERSDTWDETLRVGYPRELYENDGLARSESYERNITRRATTPPAPHPASRAAWLESRD